jgi:glycosyltransferase involved in cell wall biosynthesis
MRIVHVITRLIRAGADENTLLTCLQQVEDGHEVVLIHGREHDPHFQETHGHRIKFLYVEKLLREISPVNDIKATFILAKHLRVLRPDVVHTHTSKAGILGRIAARFSNVPAVIHGVHIVPFVNVDRKSRYIYLALERLAATLTDAFINVSNGTRDVFVEHRIGSREDHYVVHSGFDLAAYRNARRPENWKELLGLATDAFNPPVLLILAALTARKRHSQFLEVFRGIVDALPDTRLIICGDGEERSAIEAKISALSLKGNVVMMGFRSDPQRIVAMADICVLPSEREGLPRVVMQYLAGGKPCVVSHLPGIEEVVSHNVNGIILPSQDMMAMKSSIIELLADKRRLDILSNGARQTDLDNWDVAHMWPKMKAIYAKVLERDNAPVIDASVPSGGEQTSAGRAQNGRRTGNVFNTTR